MEISAPDLFDKTDVFRIIINSGHGENPAIYLIGAGKTVVSPAFRLFNNYLFKYQYTPGIGNVTTGNGGKWTDLTSNLPSSPSQWGNFNPQTGYALSVTEHPNDKNIHFPFPFIHRKQKITHYMPETTIEMLYPDWGYSPL